jgi:peptidoglycan/LPS O-acetylase OafA/YrhL
VRVLRAAGLSFLAFLMASAVGSFIVETVELPVVGDLIVSLGVLAVAGAVYANEHPDRRQPR